MKVVINSDDFGFSRCINKGIIEAFNEVLISTTTIMINMPCAENAINLWKENNKLQNKELGLGLHFNITKGPSLLGLKSLVDENNNFIKPNNFQTHKYLKNDVYEELKAQIEKLLSYGVIIDHADCHHAIHANETVREVTTLLCKEYNLPLRCEHPLLREIYDKKGIKRTENFSMLFSRKNATKEVFKKVIDENINQGINSLEIMTHLGYLDEETKKETTYITREEELNTLRELKKEGIYNKFKLVRYKELFS